MTIGNEVKKFLDSITAMVSNSNNETLTVSAHLSDIANNVDREIKYSVGNGTTISNTPIVTPLDVYNRLWDCRNLEIELVWKRTIFISAFVISCFTAYGFVVARIFADGVSNIATNLIAIGVSLVGFTLSLLWVAMAKGSKAWYEVYEQALIAWGTEYCSKCGIKNWDEIVAGVWWKIPGYKNRKRSVFGFCGGDFSVSSINILVGHLFAFVWFSLFILHEILLCMSALDWHLGLKITLALGILLFLLVLSFAIYLCPAKSKTLSDKVQAS